MTDDAENKMISVSGRSICASLSSTAATQSEQTPHHVTDDCIVVTSQPQGQNLLTAHLTTQFMNKSCGLRYGLFLRAPWETNLYSSQP